MKCIGCHGEMERLAQVPVRVGGTTGGWHLLVGDWADMTERILKLDVYRCDTCRRVEFFDEDLSLPHS